jgi:hypothetical protein
VYDGVSAALDATWVSSGTAGDAANKEPALRAELEALSGMSFIDLWEPVRERYPELFAFYEY